MKFVWKILKGATIGTGVVVLGSVVVGCVSDMIEYGAKEGLRHYTGYLADAVHTGVDLSAKWSQ